MYVIHKEKLFGLGTSATDTDISVESGSALSTNAIKIAKHVGAVALEQYFPTAESGPTILTYQVSMDGARWYTPTGSDGAADVTLAAGYSFNASTYWVWTPYPSEYIRFYIDCVSASMNSVTCNLTFLLREET